MTWLRNRWAEAESRAAVAAALSGLSMYVGDKMDGKTLLMALGGMVLAFIFPRPAA